MLYSSGLLLITYQTYSRYPSLVVVILYIGVSFLEGMSALAFYQKLRIFISEKEIVGKPLTQKILYQMMVYFIIITSGSVLLLLIVTDQFESPFEAFQYVWTAMILLLSIGGMTWKLWGIKQETPLISIIGFSLLASGVTLFNANFYQEVFILVIGNVVYSVGFWIGVWILVNHDNVSQASVSSMGDKYMITSIIRNLKNKMK